MSNLLVGTKVTTALTDLDIDELVERLTPGEIQKFLDECDPDDSSIPPALRCSYKCDKKPTGPFNRQKLLDFINDQALNTPDVPDVVPFVAGTVRGKKWTAPARLDSSSSGSALLDDSHVELDLDIGDEDCESALKNASTSEIVDLAGILGLHSLVNQDQFHSSQSDKWSVKPDPNVGLHGVTKSTPLKLYPDEQPNSTRPDRVITLLKTRDKSCTVVNLNNVAVSEEEFTQMFDALADNDSLLELSVSNTTMGDASAFRLAAALESNKVLQKLALESNRVSPHALVKIFEAANLQQSLTEIKASNQQAQFLGNKAEMAISQAIERNKSILKVGLHFEFGDCRNRVAVHLQKNLDRVRLRRVAKKLNCHDAIQG